MVVVIDGVCLLTVRGSHEPLTRVLFVSPLYVALKEKEPADGGVTELEVGRELPAPIVTVTEEVGAPRQAPLPKNAYVTLPVTPVDGNPPANVAWSVTDVPTVIVEEGLMTVVITGICLLIVKGSHELVTALLVASPL